MFDGKILAHIRELSRNGLGAPILLLIMLTMMVVPVAPLALDALFSFNIALSLIILLAVVYAMRPLDFSVFPTVLLVVTLLRLALNIASTRVVLLNGHTGPDAAGMVIKSFGEFVIGGNFAVGLVVFVILVIINFVVVTKGAGRISEVSARFTLDAMPGKQMAIDADLNAGLITQEEAKLRREEVREEADFYGAMDGASKFVRGDALAGVLILLINIAGGLAIGTLQHELSLAEAGRLYTLLTIGDGLVAQIPALLLSTAVAVIVTRMSRSQDMREQVIEQVFSRPQVLAMTAGVLGLMGMVPGMPNLAFLSLAAVCAGGAWLAYAKHSQTSSAPPAEKTGPQPVKELGWDDLSPVDAIGLEVGYRLVPLVDSAQGGELMGRIKGIRKKLSQDLGFLIPAVHIRDNLNLSPNAYRITLHGVPVGEGEVYADRDLAINPGRVFGHLEGTKTKDPAFGLDAVWIAADARDHAQTLGYTVVDASTVIATHLSQVLQTYAHELLGHAEAQQLLDMVAKTAPRLVEDLVPKQLPLSSVARVLQSLLEERISIRNIRSIVETLSEHAPRTQDPKDLTAAVRVTLGRQIVQEIYGGEDELPVITLEPNLEQLLQDSVKRDVNNPGLEPGLADRLHRSLEESVRRQEILGQPAVLLVPPGLRAALARFTRPSIPDLHVLAYNEVPENKRLRMIAAVGNASVAAA
ncbi:MAG: flagellar biosynthesis protein FlhA [Gammaproteobacteria bacterium]|nr:flagellar biosynthesis protein FlhA [Gammaproteobacteria bacterium]